MKLLFKIFITGLLITITACNQSNNKQGEDPRLAKIDSLKHAGFDIIDLHAHLKGGLTIEGLLSHSRETGIRYGVAANCALVSPFKTIQP